MRAVMRKNSCWRRERKKTLLTWVGSSAWCCLWKEVEGFTASGQLSTVICIK